MRKDYRKDLEKAARNMILINRADTLARLIVRTIIRNLRVTHAGLFILDKTTNEYIVRVSKGPQGMKVPAGFTMLRPGNPMIRYFTDPELKSLRVDFLLLTKISYLISSEKFSGDSKTSAFLRSLKNELQLYQARALVPGFFRNDLVCVLFLGKKRNKRAFAAEELSYLSVMASDVVMALQNAWLVEGLSRQLDINKKFFLNAVSSLTSAIEAKDKHTKGHTLRVVHYALKIGENLSVCADGTSASKAFGENLRIAALLHDIGKIGIPEGVLNKNGMLTEEEREYVRKHPEVGSEIVGHISEFRDIVLGVKHHHERYDGTGYPEHLSGDSIPLTAAIIAVADAFDAMTSDRPYRRAMPREDAVNEIMANSGKQFNPAIVDAFIRMLNKEPDIVPLAEEIASKGDVTGLMEKR